MRRTAGVVFLASVIGLVLGVACGPKPNPEGPPPNLDGPGTQKDPATTPPETLCEKYVSLAEANGPLEAEARKYKLQKCIGRAESTQKSSPKYYGCLVQCTFAAKDYSLARGCRYRCSPDGTLTPVPSTEPPPADSAD